jgi:hypothetical protein
VSTEDASVQGALASADYDGLDDKSDDAHLYAAKCEAFEAMVALLANMPDCRHLRQEIRKLPPIAGYSKHLLADGNPRCLSYFLLEKSGVLYALLEADTSDSQNHLSTLLLKLQVSAIGWERQLHELEMLLVKHSLVWPTSFLEKTFRNDYKRISHPKTSSLDKSLVARDSFLRWAERVHVELLRI